MGYWIVEMGQRKSGCRTSCAPDEGDVGLLARRVGYSCTSFNGQKHTIAGPRHDLLSKILMTDRIDTARGAPRHSTL